MNKYSKPNPAGVRRQNQSNATYTSNWFSPANYYVLTCAVAIAAFFLIWGLLHGYGEEMPWITAGIAASLILIVSVLAREFVLRSVYRRRLFAQKQLDYQLKSVYKVTNTKRSGTDRLTLDRNSEIVSLIDEKSKEAKSLGKGAEHHLEIFEMCNAYLQRSRRELDGMLKSSARFQALIKGRRQIEKLHRFHLLTWASLESQLLFQNSRFQSSMNDKLELAQRAVGVLESAMLYYPNEAKLRESEEAIKEYIVSVRVSHWMEQGERAAFKENYSRAISHYKDALYFLARENDTRIEHGVLADEINQRISEMQRKLKK